VHGSERYYYINKKLLQTNTAARSKKQEIEKFEVNQQGSISGFRD
jgi:hypothetical protein